METGKVQFFREPKRFAGILNPHPVESVLHELPDGRLESGLRGVRPDVACAECALEVFLAVPRTLLVSQAEILPVGARGVVGIAFELILRDMATIVGHCDGVGNILHLMAGIVVDHTVFMKARAEHGEEDDGAVGDKKHAEGRGEAMFHFRYFDDHAGFQTHAMCVICANLARRWC